MITRAGDEMFEIDFEDDTVLCIYDELVHLDASLKTFFRDADSDQAFAEETNTFEE